MSPTTPITVACGPSLENAHTDGVGLALSSRRSREAKVSPRRCVPCSSAGVQDNRRSPGSWWGAPSRVSAVAYQLCCSKDTGSGQALAWAALLGPGNRGAVVPTLSLEKTVGVFFLATDRVPSSLFCAPDRPTVPHSITLSPAMGHSVTSCGFPLQPYPDSCGLKLPGFGWGVPIRSDNVSSWLPDRLGRC